MKVVLDHVGIAVNDLAASLAFYRDVLGLEVEAPEEVASQHVRAHFIPLGEERLRGEGAPGVRVQGVGAPGVGLDPLGVVKTLYLSAAYEDALAALKTALRS